MRRSLIPIAALLLLFPPGSAEAQTKAIGTYRDAVAFASTARRAGTSAERVAADLGTSRALAVSDVLRALKEGGFPAVETATAATKTFSMTADRGVAALVEIGFSRVDAAAGFRATTNDPVLLAKGLQLAGADAGQAVEELVQIGVRPVDAVKQVGHVYSLTATVTAAQSHAAGASAAETAATLSAAGHGTSAITGALIAAGYPVAEVAAALKGMAVTLEQAAEQLDAAGVGPADLTLALVDAYTPLVGALASALRNVGNTSETVARCLEGAGFTIEQNLQGLTEAGFPQPLVGAAIIVVAATYTEAAAALRLAGWAATDVANTLAEVEPTMAGVASILRAAGYDAAQVATALLLWPEASGMVMRDALLDAGFTPAEMLAGVQSALSLGLEQTATLVMESAGLAELFTWLEDEGATPADAATWAKNAGRTANDVAAGLRDGFQLAAVDVGHAMIAAGYTAEQVMGAFKDVLGVSAEDALRIALVEYKWAAARVEAMMVSMFAMQQSMFAAQMKLLGVIREED